MSEENGNTMSHDMYLKLKKSSEPMSIMTANSFMEHPKYCKKCLEEAKKQKKEKLN